MKDHQAFLAEMEDADKRERLAGILRFVKETFPQLEEEVKWSQPMFSLYGTFIIAFSVSRDHIAVTPEPAAIRVFEEDIRKAGYSATKMLFRIKWTDAVDRELLRRLISYNMEDKKGMTTFWRKA